MARDLYATLDLNLLKTLIILSQEQNMRRAAARLFVTQPAVSQALKKLRHHFGDELFIKTHTGLQATAFTERLVNRISPVLDELSAVLNDQESLDPAGIEETVRVALSPHISSFLSGKVFDAVRKAAPAARLHLTAWNERSLDDLMKGELHMGINLEIGQTPKEVMFQKLANDRFTLYAREGHPLAAAGEILTPKDLDGCEVATLIIPDWNTRVSNIERVMQAKGYGVKVSFRSDQPRAITEVIRTTDMVYPASSYIDPSELRGLRSFQVELDEQILHFPLNAYYHQKNRRNPITLWLTGLIRALLVN
jgi:DNA-binding transcriptional LysR family regulator